MLLIFFCGYSAVEIEAETADGGGQTAMLMGRKKIWNGLQQEGLWDDLKRGRSQFRTGEKEKLPVAFRGTPKP